MSCIQVEFLIYLPLTIHTYPMRHIRFDENIDVKSRRLTFFLATEEWVARQLPAGDYFFSWQVAPTVICGRNQDIGKEVDLEYCRLNNIDVVRRRSGGGAVFADRDNFMFSFITSGDDVMTEFARYTSMVANALRKIGINANATGRNDILVDGKKISGNAFYHIPGRCIAHGTMLYDFNPTHISKALTPSRAKLESKGVKSVESRVTCLLQEGISLSADDFEKYMVEAITDRNPYIVTESDLPAILKLEKRYSDPAFVRLGGKDISIREKNSDARLISNHVRLPGIGEFHIEYTLDAQNIIHGFSISGDFFMSEDVESEICNRINGCHLRREELTARIKEISPASVIHGLDDGMLLELIIPRRHTPSEDMISPL